MGALPSADQVHVPVQDAHDVPNSVKFAVSDVPQSEEKLQGDDSARARARLCSCPTCDQPQELEAYAPCLSVDASWCGLWGHGFFTTAIYAFDQHLPLRIAPDHVFQLLEQFEHTRKNPRKANTLFWSSMVKYYSTAGSGASTYVTGWINVFFPLMRGHRNALCLPWTELRKTIKGAGGVARVRGAPDVKDFEHFMNSAPVEWQYHVQKLQLDLRTGFVGSLQDAETGELVPQLAWAVVHACACKRKSKDVERSETKSGDGLSEKIRQTATAIKSWLSR